MEPLMWEERKVYLLNTRLNYMVANQIVKTIKTEN